MAVMERNNMRVDFGKRLKRLLDKRNITQAQMAKDLNVSPATISGYVTNAHQPAIDMLIDIAEYLHVSVEELVGVPIQVDDPIRKDKIIQITEMTSILPDEDLELVLMLVKKLSSNNKY